MRHDPNVHVQLNHTQAHPHNEAQGPFPSIHAQCFNGIQNTRKLKCHPRSAFEKYEEIPERSKHNEES